MPYSFHQKSQAPKEFIVSLSDETADNLWKLAEELELDEPWPLIPLMVENMTRLLKAHRESKEELRNICLVNKKGDKYVSVGDLEAMKIAAKKMEINGLKNKPE